MCWKQLITVELGSAWKKGTKGVQRLRFGGVAMVVSVLVGNLACEA